MVAFRFENLEFNADFLKYFQIYLTNYSYNYATDEYS